MNNLYKPPTWFPEMEFIYEKIASSFIGKSFRFVVKIIFGGLEFLYGCFVKFIIFVGYILTIINSDIRSKIPKIKIRCKRDDE